VHGSAEDLSGSFGFVNSHGPEEKNEIHYVAMMRFAEDMRAFSLFAADLDTKAVDIWNCSRTEGDESFRLTEKRGEGCELNHWERMSELHSPPALIRSARNPAFGR
jgi:hypothetical protein